MLQQRSFPERDSQQLLGLSPGSFERWLQSESHKFESPRREKSNLKNFGVLVILVLKNGSNQLPPSVLRAENLIKKVSSK